MENRRRWIKEIETETVSGEEFELDELRNKCSTKTRSDMNKIVRWPLIHHKPSKTARKFTKKKNQEPMKKTIENTRSKEGNGSAKKPELEEVMNMPITRSEMNKTVRWLVKCHKPPKTARKMRTFGFEDVHYQSICR
ncbi:uncharacterized protein LOC129227492 [Uloborus diversus]|uniref:uncharacterized protein LOC129227492 n=1 Tax=Uloborus diversus TaxID=327109 RepID=UPI00240A5221|nr:uncharacterized protein LOC129227492 [Uloborus diversus]